MRLFNEYILVGGMPQSVVKYFENNRDFEECDNAKRQILSLYKDDIKKAEKKYRLKVASLFDNIPNYLSTHEKKISFNKTNKRIDYFDNALFWLDDSMMCLLCYKCLDPNVGFALNKDDSAVNAPKRRATRKIQPNEKCPCGSGLKYKQCCGRRA